MNHLKIYLCCWGSVLYHLALPLGGCCSRGALFRRAIAAAGDVTHGPCTFVAACMRHHMMSLLFASRPSTCEAQRRTRLIIPHCTSYMKVWRLTATNTTPDEITGCSPPSRGYKLQTSSDVRLSQLVVTGSRDRILPSGTAHLVLPASPCPAQHGDVARELYPD